MMQLSPARYVGTVGGRKVHRFNVVATFNDSRACRVLREESYSVLAHTAADAVNLIRDQLRTIPETEIQTLGPRRGNTYRYVGREIAVFNQMRANARAEHPELWTWVPIP